MVVVVAVAVAVAVAVGAAATAAAVLCHCWLDSRKGIQPVKNEWWDAGVVILSNPDWFYLSGAGSSG